MNNDYASNSKARRRLSGNVLAGILLLLVGGALLLRQFDAGLPSWLFRWPMILILVGLFIGIYNRFRDAGWLILCGVGFFFLADDIWPDIRFRPFIWPAVIIIVGLVLVFKSRIFRNRQSNGPPPEEVRTERIPEAENNYKTESHHGADVHYRDDRLDMVAIFGSIKKNVFSKRFRGGEIVAIFGGAEVNLMQADFNNIIVIECVQIFGGTTLFIPNNWEVRSQAAAVFGGIEDKRKDIVPGNPERILILDGFSMFGGIEIKSR